MENKEVEKIVKERFRYNNSTGNYDRTYTVTDRNFFTEGLKYSHYVLESKIKALEKVLESLPKALHDSLGETSQKYLIKRLPSVIPDKNDLDFWITHTEVGSGEPLKQWIKSEIDKLKNV